MSYDLRIYSVHPFASELFGGLAGWVIPDKRQCSFQASNWQIVVNPSDRLLPEDVEDAIASSLPGIGYLTELNLEGRYTQEAMQRLRSAAKRIAKATHGVVANPQDDSIETPAGVSRYSSPPKQESYSVIRLSWWFMTDALLHHDKRESFFGLLERQLPEAMPKRYGLYEPPQHVYAETGKEHLHQFMDKHIHELIVWYPRRPVSAIHLACPMPLGASRNGFRSNLVKIEVESAALDQPGWADNLRGFWHQMSRLLQPIYGDVRKIDGYVRHGAAVYVGASALERFDQATRSWFWRGIPPCLGQAVVLGTKYQQLWPGFVAKSEIEDELAFASVGDWSSTADLSERVGLAPQELVLRPGEGAGRSQEYPGIWPFGPVFDLPST